MVVTFEVDGTARFLYSDETAEIAREVGALTIRRASHVEPTSDGQWTADMAPVGGPVLGPFKARVEALASEVAWLNEHGVPFPHE